MEPILNMHKNLKSVEFEFSLKIGQEISGQPNKLGIHVDNKWFLF